MEIWNHRTRIHNFTSSQFCGISVRVFSFKRCSLKKAQCVHAGRRSHHHAGHYFIKPCETFKDFEADVRNVSSSSLCVCLSRPCSEVQRWWHIQGVEREESQAGGETKHLMGRPAHPAHPARLWQPPSDSISSLRKSRSVCVLWRSTDDESHDEFTSWKIRYERLSHHSACLLLSTALCYYVYKKGRRDI